MASKALPCPTVLRQLLRYEPETGRLFKRPLGPKWFSDGQKTAAHNCNVWNANYAGKEAFVVKMVNGYLKGSFLGSEYYAHRIVWAIHHGKAPKHQIDHINGDRSDNRISNLRDVPQSENAKNMSLSKANKSGVTGVFWYEPRRQWIAYIGLPGGKRKTIGYYDSKSEAVAARLAANVKYGYHRNHGKPLDEFYAN